MRDPLRQCPIAWNPELKQPCELLELEEDVALFPAKRVGELGNSTPILLRRLATLASCTGHAP